MDVDECLEEMHVRCDHVRIVGPLIEVPLLVALAYAPSDAPRLFPTSKTERDIAPLDSTSA